MEKVATSYSNIRVARVNIDENEALGQQMQYSLFQLFGVVGSRPVEGFTGASQNQPCGSLSKSWLLSPWGSEDIVPLIEAGRASLSERRGRGSDAISTGAGDAARFPGRAVRHGSGPRRDGKSGKRA